MGIDGLYNYVKEACVNQVSLGDLSNTVVAIDSRFWLRHSLISVSYELFKGQTVSTHINYCFRKIDELKKYYIKPIFVFEGCNLPAKSDFDAKRKEEREKVKKELNRLLEKGDTKTAYKLLPRAIEISQELTKQLIDRLIEERIDYIVSPYESDAQISYLVRYGFANFAISEDTDLILFGCDYVLFKLTEGGTGTLFCHSNLKCIDGNSSEFDFTKFKRMCILSGCDYLKNLPGIGLMKSKIFFSNLNSDENIEKELQKLPTVLNMKKLTVSKNYLKKFTEAEKVFNHQLVFCPKAKKLRPIFDYDKNSAKEHLDYTGNYLENDLALNLSIGNVDFKTLKIINSLFLENFEKKYFNSIESIWNKDYKLVNRESFEAIIDQLSIKLQKNKSSETLNLPEKRKVRFKTNLPNESQNFFKKALSAEKIQISQNTKRSLDNPSKKIKSNYFNGFEFFIDESFNPETRDCIERCIIFKKGKISKNLDESVSYIVINEKNTKTEQYHKLKEFNHIINQVNLKWLLRCHEADKLLPSDL